MSSVTFMFGAGAAGSGGAAVAGRLADTALVGLPGAAPAVRGLSPPVLSSELPLLSRHDTVRWLAVGALIAALVNSGSGSVARLQVVPAPLTAALCMPLPTFTAPCALASGLLVAAASVAESTPSPERRPRSGRPCS